ncbi:uncharacterized protein LOC135198897 isoform X1 [Macrobrachium nipponense]|uniref:uncharacterized protein LOC135198897 isoform X1 n=2 Tax=Macrobrachium nipponense TaxID=159736 RepID=UPI0030C86E36
MDVDPGNLVKENQKSSLTTEGGGTSKITSSPRPFFNRVKSPLLISVNKTLKMASISPKKLSEEFRIADKENVSLNINRPEVNGSDKIRHRSEEDEGGNPSKRQRVLIDQDTNSFNKSSEKDFNKVCTPNKKVGKVTQEEIDRILDEASDADISCVSNNRDLCESDTEVEMGEGKGSRDRETEDKMLMSNKNKNLKGGKTNIKKRKKDSDSDSEMDEPLSKTKGKTNIKKVKEDPDDSDSEMDEPLSKTNGKTNIKKVKKDSDDSDSEMDEPLSKTKGKTNTKKGKKDPDDSDSEMDEPLSKTKGKTNIKKGKEDPDDSDSEMDEPLSKTKGKTNIKKGKEDS